MSHQVNFYMTPADTRNLIRKLEAIHPFVMLHSRSATPKPFKMSTEESECEVDPWLFRFLVRAEDVDAVSTNFVPAQDYWSIDVLKSPVIEFSQCFFDGEKLRRGRIYFLDAYYGVNDQLITKPEGFRVWANAVLAAAKRFSVKHGSDYIGPDAAAWLKRSKGSLLP